MDVSIFPVFDTASSGLYANRVWMDAISDNIANVNTVKPYNQAAFQTRWIQVQSVNADNGDPVGVGGGVQVVAAQFGSPQGIVHYDPTNPLANAEGLVREPDVDLGDQMTQLIEAQRSYEMNLTVIDRARDSYQQAIEISDK